MIRRDFMAGFTLAAGALARAQEPLPAPRPAPGPAEIPPAGEELLLTGTRLVLRVREVIPHDGIAPAERVLNGQPAIKPCDRFLADIDGARQGAAAIGGKIESISPPGLFGREGKMNLLLSQVVESRGDQVRPWRLVAGAEGPAGRHRRLLLNSLLLAEGAGVGSSIASQFTFSSANPGIMAIGGGAGLVIATAIAATRRGVAARLDPGDRFEATVGDTKCKPLPPAGEFTIYPAQERAKP